MALRKEGPSVFFLFTLDNSNNMASLTGSYQKLKANTPYHCKPHRQPNMKTNK